MLRPAHVIHLPLLRSLIRNGAAHGSFDPELATDSPDALLFFANLRQALVTGYFALQDQRTGQVRSVIAPGYVYFPDTRGAHERPIGFGIFREFAEGYELWLTGIDEAWRGHGHGRQMVSSLLATPAGRFAWIVRVNRASEYSTGMTHLLAEQGYHCERETDASTWYIREGAPASMLARVRSAPISRTSFH
jgi:GNAT superfamily N-acetyltransferase